MLGDRLILCFFFWADGSSLAVGMASVAAAPSTVHASATFDGYGVSTGTAATSIQSGKCQICFELVIVRISF